MTSWYGHGKPDLFCYRYMSINLITLLFSICLLFFRGIIILLGERFNNLDQSLIVSFTFKAVGNIKHNACLDSFCGVK